MLSLAPLHPLLALLADLDGAAPSSAPKTLETSTWVALVVGVVATMVIVARAKRKRDPLDPPSGGRGLSQQRSVDREMQNVLVELSEMSRQIGAQLDTRSKKLELLIDHADQRIAELRRLGEAAVPQANPARPPAPAPNLPSNDGNSSAAAANDQRGNASGSATASSAPEMDVPSIDPHHAAIYAFADEGHSAGDIAAHLGRPVGEIDLILKLRPRAAAGAGEA